jgi:hypothetical protein
MTRCSSLDLDPPNRPVVTECSQPGAAGHPHSTRTYEGLLHFETSQKGNIDSAAIATIGVVDHQRPQCAGQQHLL